MCFYLQLLIHICHVVGDDLLILTLLNRRGSPTFAGQLVNHGTIRASRCKANQKSMIEEFDVRPMDLGMPK
jgi:hypothetical protein